MKSERIRFKLDENLGSRWLSLFSELGHQADTVIQEKLGGAPDETVFEACIREQRCLVTLDLDFADVLRFSPKQTEGVAILRVPPRSPASGIENLLRNLLTALETETIRGCLWIVETTRIRIHDPK